MFCYESFFKSLVLCIFICCSLSCQNAKRPKVMSDTKYKSISRILKETKVVDVHLDRRMCRTLIETLSKRSAIEILSLSTEEKNEILRIAITAGIDITPFFKTVTARVSKGLDSTIKDDPSLKKELLESIDASIDMTVIKVILSDGEYLKIAEVDSILFAMALMLGQATSRDGYEKTKTALREGDSKTVVDLLSKISIEVVLYSYGVIRSREDIQTMTFAGVKLIDLLPEMKVNF